MSLRFEDVSQDGRLMLTGIPHGLGETLWRDVLARHPLQPAMLEDGVIPILSRLVIDGLESPIGVGKLLEASSAFQLAHTVDATGTVDRLILNLWLDVHGERGVTHGPPPAGAGERLHVGRAFAEHVFTRPFAPPSERKVVRFEREGLPPVPDARYVWRNAEELLSLPHGAAWIEPALTADPATVVLGMGHTDSNQHVNSLVYPKLLEAAALRRFAALGLGSSVLPRAVELVFRKPSFAGESLVLELRAFRAGSILGVVATIGMAGDPRPRVIARMVFEP
jgi:hypothetical protein